MFGADLAWAGDEPARSAVPTIDEAALLAAIAASDPRLDRLAAEVDLARAEILTAGLRAEPSIAFDREEVFGDGGAVPTSYLRLVVPIDLSGRRARRIAAAQAGVAAADADTAQTRFGYLVDALRVFQTAAHARLLTELLDEERAALVRAVEIGQKRTSAGDASGYDVTRLELELAAYDDLRRSASIELDSARRRLGALVGDGGLVDAASSLPLPPLPALDVALDGAVERRGDYQATLRRGEAARAEESVAARAWVPSISITAGVMSADLGTDTAYGYVAGIQVSLPIFDRGQALRARARAAQHAATAEARTIERLAPAAAQTAHAVLAVRIEQATSVATEQIARLEALLRAAESAYREGDVGVVELLDAYRTAREVRLRELSLRRDAADARLDLALALGYLP